MRYLNPYRQVVVRTITTGFKALNNGDYKPILDRCSEDVQYVFEGQHALAGNHDGKTAVADFFELLTNKLPSSFLLHTIIVQGWPWHTTVIVEFTDSVRPVTGAPYQNNGVQIIDLRWGKVRRIHTFVDTQKIAHALAGVGL